MTTTTNTYHALRRFEENKDNPLVQAITKFITNNIGRPLTDIASWGVEMTDTSPRAFYLRFIDGAKYSGKLYMHVTWQVAVFGVGSQVESEDEE